MSNERSGTDLLIDNSLVDALLEESADILLMVDESLKVLRANQNASVFFGIPAGLLEGRDLESVLGSKHCERIREIAGLLDIDGETTRVHLDLADYLGKRRQRIVGIRRVKCSRTGVDGYLLMIRQDRRAPDWPPVTMDPRALVMRFLKGLSDSVILVDSTTHLTVDCNLAAESLFGYRREEILGRSPQFLAATPELAREYQRRARECYAKNGFYQDVVQCKRKDGSLFTTMATNLAIYDSEGTQLNTVAINRDLAPIERRYDDILRIAEQSETLAKELKEAVLPLKRSKPNESLGSLGFSSRQIEIAAILVTGEPTKVIARTIGLSEATIKNSLSAMYRLLGVSSRMEFLRFISERQIRIE